MRRSALRRRPELRAAALVTCEPGGACWARFSRPATARWQVASAAGPSPTTRLDGGGASCSGSSLGRVQQLLLAWHVGSIETRGWAVVAAAAPLFCCDLYVLPAHEPQPPHGCCRLPALVATPRRSHQAASLRLPAGRCQRAARSPARTRLQQRFPLQLVWQQLEAHTSHTHFHSAMRAVSISSMSELLFLSSKVPKLGFGTVFGLKLGCRQFPWALAHPPEGGGPCA